MFSQSQTLWPPDRRAVFKLRLATVQLDSLLSFTTGPKTDGQTMFKTSVVPD